MESYRPIFLINIREGRGGEGKEGQGKGGLTDPTLLSRLHPFPTFYSVTFVIIQVTMYLSVYYLFTATLSVRVQTETTQISIDNGMDKQIMVYSDYMYYNKNGQTKKKGGLRIGRSG